MINQNLHRQPVPLDSQLHGALKLRVPVTDWSFASNLNAMFVAAAEFSDVCREFPIVFVRAGKEDDGKDQIAPIAVLGLTQDQNLYIENGVWRTQYVPAVMRSYPFCIGRIDAERFAICVDMAWPGTRDTDGEAVFDAAGQPSEMLKNVRANLELLEGEIQRTRAIGQKLQELDLLREMRFDATMHDGSQHSVDGFLTVDDTKMQALPDTVLGDLHRSGVLGLIHLHWVSLGNMRRLVDWHAGRVVAAKAAAASTPAA